VGRKLNKVTSITIILIGLLAFTALNATGSDDVIDSINEAIEYYKDGKLEETIRSLNDASQLIQQLIGKNKLEALLPEPLEGWIAAVAHSPSGGRMGLSLRSTDFVRFY